jgi:hypothetical protein
MDDVDLTLIIWIALLVAGEIAEIAAGGIKQTKNPNLPHPNTATR